MECSYTGKCSRVTNTTVSQSPSCYMDTVYLYSNCSDLKLVALDLHSNFAFLVYLKSILDKIANISFVQLFLLLVKKSILNMCKTPNKMHINDMVKIDTIVFEIVGGGGLSFDRVKTFNSVHR